MKIRSIHLKNFLIIRHTEIHLHSGLTAVTGETGSGKSLFVEAVRMLLGGRGNKTLVGPWLPNAEVSAVIEIEQGDKSLFTTLADLAFDPDENGCITVRRIVGEKNTSFINGAPVPTQKLTEIFSDWIEISSQFENRELYQSAYQTAVLDAFGVSVRLRQEYEKQWRNLQDIRNEIEQLRALDDPRRRDYLSFQIEELASFAPQEGEDVLLAERIRIVENRKRLDALAAKGAEALSAAADAIAVADRTMSEMARLTSLDDLSSRTASLLIECRDIERSFSSLITSWSETGDEESLRSRYDTLNRLLMKHGVPDAAGLIATWHSLEKEAALLAEIPSRLTELEERERSVREKAKQTAESIHQARLKAAPKLEKKLSDHLRTLGMETALFRVVVTPTEELTPHGSDTVRFMVNTTGTSDLRDIKTLSGGELSRLLLALKLVDQETGRFILFDEIDANIGGETAARAAAQLRESAQRNQILVVTHFPQTAAHAGTHIVVEKATNTSGSVETVLRCVEGDDRVRELARMMGDSTSRENLRAAHKLLEK